MSIKSDNSVDTTDRHAVLVFFDSLWDKFTSPARTVVGSERRRQAQLLMTLLLVMITLTIIGVVAIYSFPNSEGALQSSTTGFVLLSLLLLIACYVVSRTRYYLAAAAITLVITAAAIFGAILSAPTGALDLTRYLVLGMLICGIMFSLRVTVFVAAVYVIISMIIMLLIFSPVSSDDLYSLTYLIIGSTLILTFMRYRDLTEADRQQILATARDELRVSRELYRTLARNLPRSAVLLYDHDLRYLLAEGTALPQIGYSKEIIEGKTLYDMVPPEQIKESERLYRAALAGNEQMIEYAINGEDYRVYYVPIRNEIGIIVAGMSLIQNVSAEKTAQAALRESEERYRLMAENATDLISVQSPDGEYSYASPATRLLLGYNLDELIGRTVFEFIHPDDAARVYDLYQETLSAQEIITVTYRIRRADGTYTWFESASRLITDPTAGNQIVTASRDISDRMASSEALRQSEEQLRSLIASLDNLVFSIDLNGYFLVYHPTPLSIYDTPFDTEIFIGRHYRDVLPGVLADQLEAAADLVTTSLSTQQIDYDLEVDGIMKFYSARISPMISTNLHLLGSTVVVSDVTEAMRARQREQRLLALEKIQRQIGALFLEIDDPEIVIDPILEILATSFDVARAYMFKLRENERLIDNTHEWSMPGTAPQIQNMQSLAFDELFPSLLPLLVNDGIIASEHIRDLPEDVYRFFAAQNIQSVLILPFFVDERLDGFIGFDEVNHARQWLPEESAAVRAFAQSLAHMLERQRAQLALIEARDSALRSARLKSDFVSNMSHEIRTPMTGVIGMLDLLHETTLNEDQTEIVEIAHSSANRLLTLVNDILDFSKIEAGKIALEKIPLDVRGVITEVQSILSVQAAKKQLQLIIDVSEDVPSRVLGDPTRLRQILMNLVGNAIKFTENGSIRIVLTQLNALHGRSRLRFEIRDTGIGIPPDRQATIFDSFVQADSSTTRRYGGAGLGLAICKQLASLMDSNIDIQSTPSVGSTFGFTVTLPIVALASRAVLNPDFKFLQVLVVDDDSTGRYLLAQQLRLWGTNVIEASSPEEAYNLLVTAERRGEEVDLVMCHCRISLAEQEALVAQLREALSANPPTLVQLFDDQEAESVLFDIRLLRSVRPSVLYDLLLTYLNGEAAVPIEPLIDDRLIPSSIFGRILVADDEPMNREIVVRALEQFGYKVDSARNGQEVIEQLDDHEYSLILMDIYMPVMDGIEATRQIRALDTKKRQIPIIALTASIQADERQTYLDAGISAIIGKPFSLRELRDTVEVWTTAHS